MPFRQSHLTEDSEIADVITLPCLRVAKAVCFHERTSKRPFHVTPEVFIGLPAARINAEGFMGELGEVRLKEK